MQIFLYLVLVFYFTSIVFSTMTLMFLSYSLKNNGDTREKFKTLKMLYNKEKENFEIDAVFIFIPILNLMTCYVYIDIIYSSLENIKMLAKAREEK